jgi:hypothetical protein
MFWDLRCRRTWQRTTRAPRAPRPAPARRRLSSGGLGGGRCARAEASGKAGGAANRLPPPSRPPAGALACAPPPPPPPLAPPPSPPEGRADSAASTGASAASRPMPPPSGASAAARRRACCVVRRTEQRRQNPNTRTRVHQVHAPRARRAARAACAPCARGGAPRVARSHQRGGVPREVALRPRAVVRRVRRRCGGSRVAAPLAKGRRLHAGRRARSAHGAPLRPHGVRLAGGGGCVRVRAVGFPIPPACQGFADRTSGVLRTSGNAREAGAAGVLA